MKFPPCFAFLIAGATAFGGERIKQEGRILGPVPVFTQSILFNTAAADAVATPPKNPML